MPQTRGKFASQFGPSELHLGSILSLAPSITVKAQAGVISLRAGWSMEGSMRGVDSQRKMARLFPPPQSLTSALTQQEGYLLVQMEV